MKRIPSPRLLACLCAWALLQGCGANTPDTFRGRWSLVDLTCDSASTALPSGLTSVRVTYGDALALEVVYSGPSCTLLRYTGTFERAGLTVVEHITAQDCGTGCVIAGLGVNCTGTSSVEQTGGYRVDLSEVDRLSQGEFTQRVLCAPAGGLYVNERETFHRL